MTCDTVWGVTWHLSGQNDLRCHIKFFTTQPPDNINKTLRYNIFTRMDVYNEFELDRMFGIWNSAIWEVSSLIQMARNIQVYSNYRQGLQGIFHCSDYLQWAYRPDQVLLSTFILALELEFELALHQHNEGYDTDNIYNLQSPPQMRVVLIPSGSQGGAASTSPLTLTGRAVEPYFTD